MNCFASMSEDVAGPGEFAVISGTRPKARRACTVGFRGASRSFPPQGSYSLSDSIPRPPEEGRHESARIRTNLHE